MGGYPIRMMLLKNKERKLKKWDIFFFKSNSIFEMYRSVYLYVNKYQITLNMNKINEHFSST